MDNFDRTIWIVIILGFLFILIFIGYKIYIFPIMQQVCEDENGEFSFWKWKCEFYEDGYLIGYSIQKYKGEYVLVK
ncbi:hypothetical protein LCGC14_1433830 [marine sediment metagenome]|uniref:Uncharacterized protein n=1 Tax=marine sediment metagenome TaxID=412755 RepID=A0A0F9MPP0_9ZZZZ